jgi:hypothetical protein
MKQLPAGNSLAFAQIAESHSDPIRLTQLAEQILGSLRHVVKSIPEKKSVVTRTGTTSLKLTYSSLGPPR